MIHVLMSVLVRSEGASENEQELVILNDIVKVCEKRVQEKIIGIVKEMNEDNREKYYYFFLEPERKVLALFVLLTGRFDSLPPLNIFIFRP